MAAITLRRVACESARARFASSLALRTTFSHISDESCVDRAIQNLEEHLSRGRDFDDSLAKWKFAGFRSPRRPLGSERAWTASGSTASACVGLVQSRSFAAKAKKPKSKAEDTVEVADVSDTAKESALKMMDTALDVLARELSKLRTGRVSPGMLDHITVEAHGVRTPLSHIAAVSVAGLQTLNVLPYDPSMLKEVEKALLMSPLGLNPLVEGSTLTVPLPSLCANLQRRRVRTPSSA
ncbi:ribosome recycling factor [Marchantia polymorpha subsp. ruderalis]|uniref:Ribosome-recycling factor, chloroplastic n=2 Tax=Marchantia polymorpha TaxID=3197 RepID=A0AAF6AKI0_MARPO|nr:hypothetical protein MARPO_0029s0063 [Marchantia polymorpha]BBM96950.1 hypothetical protein Mp_1g01830 [Marchantia polymorpha subsp. ruderalis]|eukprot:PTQ42533.1 hypothetical protein MARPO_0029s0063 [Marchantia polymorpha]